MTKKITKESFNSQFKDKIIVVTGSTQGSGAETAKLLAMRGAKGITICGRNVKKGKLIKKQIEHGDRYCQPIDICWLESAKFC